jgi:hypothetical protein
MKPLPWLNGGTGMAVHHVQTSRESAMPKVIELLQGHTYSRRVVVFEGTREITVADDTRHAWQVYRPTGKFNVHGMEIWSQVRGSPADERAALGEFAPSAS